MIGDLPIAAVAFGAIVSLILGIRIWRAETRKRKEREEYHRKAMEEYREKYMERDSVLPLNIIAGYDENEDCIHELIDSSGKKLKVHGQWSPKEIGEAKARGVDENIFLRPPQSHKYDEEQK